MKRFILLISLALLGIPAFAQDDGDGGFDINSIFGNDPSGGTVIAAPKVDPFLVDLRNLLLTANAPPVEQKQEGALKKAYEKEWKAQAKSFEKRFGIALETAWAAQNPARGGRGRRGGARLGSAQAAEVRRISDQLLDRMIAALRIDQQAALRRHQSEQVRIKRLDVMNQSMTSAGLSLTAQQKVEMEALYARESRLRTLIIVEAKGAPHQVQVNQLELQTTERVVQLLDPSQKTALEESMAGSGAR